MKKILTLLTICAAVIASVCSIDVKQASAEEEPATTSETYSNNLFSSISYRSYSDDSNNYYYDNELVKETELLTNIMPVDVSDKDLLISMKFKLSDTSIDIDTVDATELSLSGIEYYDNNFLRIKSDFFAVYGNTDIIEETYELDASGEYLVCNILYPNPTIKYSTAKYFTINPQLKYKNLTGHGIIENGVSISEMYVSFVEKDSIKTSIALKGLNIDYTPRESNVTWSSNSFEITSNYVSINVLETTDIKSVASTITAADSSMKKMRVSYGTISADEVHVPGGKYDYILKASDTNGNYDFILLSLNVVDKTPPMVAGSKEYNVPNTAKLSVDAVKNTLIVTDNVDSAEDITLSVKYDYYTDNYNTPGVYYVCFTAMDKSNNTTDFIVKITVEDKNAPVFYNSNNLPITNINVHKSPSAILLMSDVINTLTAKDAIDGTRDITIYSDGYTGNGDVEGTYLVVLKATDKAGNIAYCNINIQVSKNIPSKTILIGKNYVIVESSVKLSKTDFNSIINITNPVIDSITYTNISDEIYSASSECPGNYLVEYKRISTNGYEYDDVLTVKVIEARSNGAIKDEPEEDDGFIMSVLKFILNIFKTFFEWLGSIFK